jgi:translocation and assembly module TamB
VSVEAGPFDPEIVLRRIDGAEVDGGGSFHAAGRVRGARGAIFVEGRLAATVPSVRVPSIGLDARNARVDVAVTDRRLEIRAAEADIGKGKRKNKGKIRLSGTSVLPALAIDLDAQNMAFEVRRRFAVKADARMALRGTTAAPALTGTLHLDQATYEIPKKKRMPGAAGGEKPESNMEEARLFQRVLSWSADVNVNWDGDVWYRDGLTKVETQANVDVRKDSGDRLPRLSGDVTLVRGSYDAFGRDFVVKDGALSFNGPDAWDPSLNIHASHEMEDALVEVDLSGTAKKPEVRLRSTPPMPEQDILAMLALGKAPGQSTSSSNEGNAGKELAADAVSSYLTREVRSAGMNVLDLDVVRMKPSDTGTEWTVGRYLGSKFFMSYSYNPENSASQVLKAEYSFSPRWTVIAQSGSQSDNYLDINFRLPVGKRR